MSRGRAVMTLHLWIVSAAIKSRVWEDSDGITEGSDTTGE